jgi:hypothetical protein
MNKLFQNFCLSFIFVLLTFHTSDAQVSYIWWEGEEPVETNFPKSTWFSTGAISESKHLLSNNQWLTNEGNRSGAEAFAKYEVTIPESGTYDFWVRKFWKHGPFRWRFGTEEWQTVGRDIALADSVTLTTNIGANWVSVGSVTLPKGKIPFEIRLLAAQGESLTACFDCFLLTQIPFVPRGKLKPDEKSGNADDGFFAWEPEIDTFQDDALLDLRSLNESFAGVNGYVRNDGSQFVLGDGTPVKFWAVNVSSGIAGLNRKSIEYLARKLAKNGVNMVRFHSPLFDSSDPMLLDEKKLDDLLFLIAAMKNEGIYTSLSFYFPLWFDIESHYGIPGYDTINNKRPFALLYFNERMQEIYESWLKKLLAAKSPYTNLTLAQEPAVAIIEIINEDSFFFWTFTKSNVPQVHWDHLETLFGKWLMERYGSLQKAFAEWGNLRVSGDDISQNKAAIYEAWHMTGDAIRQSNANKVKRVGDQVRFLTELQRSYYTKVANIIHNEFGSKSLVSPSNWHVTDPYTLDALERYTYTAGESIDKHGYFSGEHTSSDGTHSYSVREGHSFKNLSALTVPESLPLQFVQMNNYPHTISEIGWTNPNLYRADYAFLASAYGALQGVDAFYTFAVGGAFWDTAMNKFALSSPVIFANFPAYALLYRRGDITEADPVIHQIIDLEDLYAMKGSGAFEAQALDELRLADVPPGSSASGEVESLDPLAFYVGKVIREFGSNTEDSKEMNLSGLINREEGTVESITQELLWNYKNGLATINTETCQGTTGFLKDSGYIKLDNIQIQSNNEYGSVIVISIDGKPLKQSNSMLIQTMTTERPYQFRASNGKEGTITNVGSYPFGVELIDTTVTFMLDKGHKIQAIALDENGYATERPVDYQVTDNGQRITMLLNSQSVYHILQRQTSTPIKEWSLY